MTAQELENLKLQASSLQQRIALLEHQLGTVPISKSIDVKVMASRLVSHYPEGILPTIEVPYDGHVRAIAPNPLKSTAQKYDLPHRADLVIVQGTYDYQAEIDQPVNSQTPITPALVYWSVALKASEYVSYVISPDVITSLGNDIEGTFYVDLYWWGS